MDDNAQCGRTARHALFNVEAHARLGLPIDQPAQTSSDNGCRITDFRLHTSVVGSLTLCARHGNAFSGAYVPNAPPDARYHARLIAATQRCSKQITLEIIQQIQ
jgi:hypothetical protein